jgi:hypothetical protein
VICGTASFYARKTVDFPGIKGKESCKKWHRSFFYMKNLKEGEDHINLPPFEAGGPDGITGALLFLAHRRTWRRFFCGSPPYKRRVA